MMVGRVFKEASDHRRVVVGFSHWLDPAELVITVSTPVISVDPDATNTTPLVAATPVLTGGGTGMTVMLTGGTAGLIYLVSMTVTADVSARVETLEFYCTVNPPPAISITGTQIRGPTGATGPAGPTIWNAGSVSAIDATSLVISSNTLAVTTPDIINVYGRAGPDWVAVVPWYGGDVTGDLRVEGNFSIEGSPAELIFKVAGVARAQLSAASDGTLRFDRWDSGGGYLGPLWQSNSAGVTAFTSPTGDPFQAYTAAGLHCRLALEIIGQSRWSIGPWGTDSKFRIYDETNSQPALQIDPVTAAVQLYGALTGVGGSFTTLAASSTVSGTGFTSRFATPGPIGNTVASTGAFTTLSATSTVSGAGFTAWAASPPSIGSTAPGTGAFTTLAASSTVSGTGFTNRFASPGPIGSTAASTGAFTTLSATSTISGAGFTAWLASPPAIGGTAPAAGAFTTLSASSTVSGTGFTNRFATPGPIGNTVASTGAFTTLSATGQITSTQATGSAPFVVASTTNVANLNASSLSGATMAAPGAIGGTTPAAGTFTQVNLTTSSGPNLTSGSGAPAATQPIGSLYSRTDGVVGTSAYVSLGSGNWQALADSSVLYGTGSDGAVTISAGTTTLTRDMHYAALTMSGTGKLNTAGFRVFVSGTLDISAAANQAIYVQTGTGGNASGATAGSGAGSIAAPNVPFHGVNGTTGGAGGTGVGAVGVAGSAPSALVLSSQGSAGGVGGTASAGATAGGLGGAVNTGGTITTLLTPFFYSGQALACSGSNSTGGGAGAGDGVNTGGGGGGGATGQTALYIFAFAINRGASTAVGALWCKGGNGGNGGNAAGGNAGGGGGGGGGQGGYIFIVCNTLIGTTATNAIDITAGNGGTGGNGAGTGIGGTGGLGGRTGGYSVLNFGAKAMAVLAATNAAGAAATAATTTAGTTGGSGVTTQANL